MKIIQLLHRFKTASCTFIYLGPYLKITGQTINILQKKSFLIVVHAIAHLDPAFQ